MSAMYDCSALRVRKGIQRIHVQQNNITNSGYFENESKGAKVYSLASKFHLLLFVEVAVMVSVTCETGTLVHTVGGSDNSHA